MESNGILLTNIVDNFKKGAFLPSYIKTLREVFEDKVFLLSTSPDFDNININTFIVVAGYIDIDNFKKFIENNKNSNITSVIVPKNLLDKYINKKHAVVLTDDYAPVDNLIAPVFEERFDYRGIN